MNLCISACILGLISVPALADGIAPPAPAAAAPAISDLDKVQCRIYPPPLGSRIGERRICHTKREWNEIERAAQDTVNNLVRQGDQSGSHSTPGGPGGGG